MADKNETRDSDADQDEDAPESEPTSSAKSAGAKLAPKAAPSKAAAAKAKPVVRSAVVEDADDEEDDESDEEDDESDEEDGEDGEDEAYRDASTRGVAKALGVDGEEDREADGEDDGPEEAAVVNRAARRRDEAQKRRAARGLAKTSVASDDDAAPARDPERTLPKDKNARAKELLKRRQEASTTRGVQLDAGEMIQDSLARAGSATAKGLRQNLGFIGAVIGIAAAGAIGYFVWTGHKDGKIAAASDDLMAGVEADRAPTQKEDKRTDEEKKNDPTPFYTSNDVRTDTALASYKKVIDEHGDSGPAILAKLGQGGVYLEKAQYDKAIDSYNQVISSSLANAEADVKARATEGIGFAREGKGDLDGANQSFKDLEGIKGYEDLAKYHQARMLMKKGKLDDAKEALLALRKIIDVPTGPTAPPNEFLTEAVNELLGSIDPSLSRHNTRVAGMRGDSMTDEEQGEAQNRAIEALKRQIQQQQKDHPGSPIQMPKMPGEDQE